MSTFARQQAAVQQSAEMVFIDKDRASWLRQARFVRVDLNPEEKEEVWQNGDVRISITDLRFHGLRFHISRNQPSRSARKDKWDHMTTSWETVVDRVTRWLAERERTSSLDSFFSARREPTVWWR